MEIIRQEIIRLPLIKSTPDTDVEKFKELFNGIAFQAGMGCHFEWKVDRENGWLVADVVGEAINQIKFLLHIRPIMLIMKAEMKSFLAELTNGKA